VELLIQLPVTDLRGLVIPYAGRHKRPTWPTGTIGIEPGTGEFVPRFGQLRTPHTAMTDGWAGRAQCVSAAHALRLPDRFGQYYNDSFDGEACHAELRDRCYFGSAVSPRGLAEIGINIQTPNGQHRWPQIDAIITATTQIPIRVPNSPRTCPVIHVGPRFANFLRMNTTAKSFNGTVPSWLVTAGKPVIILLTHSKIHGDPPAQWERPDGTRNLYYCQVRGADVWVVQETDIRRSRRIGMQIGRLHIERATYGSLARHLARSSGTKGAYTLDANQPPVQFAIKECAKYINKTFSYGEDQSALQDVLSVDLVLHATEWDSLRESFSLLPESLSRMAIPALNNLVAEQINIFGGDTYSNISESQIVNRSKVIDSFNTIAGKPDPGIEEFLRNLAEQVEELNNRDAADLTEEFIAAVADKKKPMILRLLWTRLKEVAPVVAKIDGAASAIQTLTVSS
jgi:hypothetical protein